MRLGRKIVALCAGFALLAGVGAAMDASFMDLGPARAAAATPQPHSNAAPTAIGTDSHLPVPRFVSLKEEGANARRGPNVNQPILWIYQRRDLPLEITGESGPWRRVRDPGGSEVWMHKQNLDPRRTVYVHGQDHADAAMRERPQANSKAVAYLAEGVVARLTGCDGEWRRVTVGGRVGWVRADALWAAGDCSWS